MQIQLEIQPVRENLAYRQWDVALLDPAQLKRQIKKKAQIDQRDKKSFKLDTCNRANQIFIHYLGEL